MGPELCVDLVFILSLIPIEKRVRYNSGINIERRSLTEEALYFLFSHFVEFSFG
jgi:hypothetical protein